MIEARISDQLMFSMDSIAVQIVERYEGHIPRVLKTGDGGMGPVWEDFPDDGLAEAPLTMTLRNDVARALLDALLRHYQGASDMHTVRSDLLHERGRVDKLTDAVIRIASGPVPR